MAEASKSNNWASLIPDLYYDLIGRIPSGAYVVVLGTWLFFSPAHDEWASTFLQISGGTATILLVVFLAASYIIGLLLTAIADIFYKRCTMTMAISKAFAVVSKDLDSYPDLKGHFNAFNEAKRHNDKDKIRAEEAKMHYCLKEHSPKAGGIVSKMRGEASLAYNILVGTLLVAALRTGYLYLGGMNFREAATEYLVLAFFVLLSGIAAPYRSRRYAETQIVLLVQYYKKISNDSAPDSDINRSSSVTPAGVVQF